MTDTGEHVITEVNRIVIMKPIVLHKSKGVREIITVMAMGYNLTGDAQRRQHAS